MKYRVMKKRVKFFKITMSAALIAAVLFVCSCSHTESTTDTETEFVLDTFCTVTVSGSDSKSAISEAFKAAHAVQKATDFYDPYSAVSAFNAAPAGTPVTLDDDTFNIVCTALEVSERSEGAFDITVAPVSELWDFKASEPRPPEDATVKNALRYVGRQNIVLDKDAKTLTKLTDGIMIDLGGCAKGYACEKIQKLIAEKYPDSYALIDFGGNIGVCGTNPKHKDGSTVVGIQEPFKETGVYNRTTAVYSGQSAVTSGTYQRHFYYNGQNYHHILDPSTGYPAESGLNSVTVISGSSLLADCLSTACFVLGEEKGTALANQYGAETIWIK